MRKISKKLNKSQKSLLIGMLIGDGTITNHPDYKIDHSMSQEEYLKWKLSLLDSENIKNTGFKLYKSSSGYNKGETICRVRVSTNMTIKALRRSIYIPKKTITRNLLNWLTAREVAIWFMDDGCININTSEQRGNSIQRVIKIATCVNEPTVNIIIDYFKEVWNIDFRPFKEGKDTYSIASCTEEDCIKFVQIVKPYVLQVPSLLYKIRSNYTKTEFIEIQSNNPRSAEQLLL